jgi:hypothetical protein
LNNLEKENFVAQASAGISLLCDSFDMKPFCKAFLERLTSAMAGESVPIETKRFVAEGIQDLVKNCASEFCEVCDAVLPPLLRVSGVLGDLTALLETEDDEELDVDLIIVAFMKCLLSCMNALVSERVQNEKVEMVVEGVIDLLEMIGGMKEHGDDLLCVSVEAMGKLIQCFPDRTEEYFGHELGFELVLRAAKEAELMPELLSEIFNFFGM